MIYKSINTDAIEAYIKNNNLTVKKFCKKCKISPYIFNKMMSQDINNCKIKINAIYKISITLKIKFNDLIK